MFKDCFQKESYVHERVKNFVDFIHQKKIRELKYRLSLEIMQKQMLGIANDDVAQAYQDKIQNAVNGETEGDKINAKQKQLEILRDGNV
jgi:hypothetical protein